METNVPIEQLVVKVLLELERLNYSSNTISSYRSFYNRFITFVKEKDDNCFSEELGRIFLEEKYNCTTNYYTEAMPKSLRYIIRKIRVLGDFQIHGVVIRRIVKKPAYVKPPQLEKELQHYENECEENEYSNAGFVRECKDFTFLLTILIGVIFKM